MKNDLFYIIQSMSIDNLKEELDNNKFVDKDLKDFEEGKEIIDNLSKLNDIDDNVKYALLLYVIYKAKGGK